jgi:D-alanyl-D-alanine carboxypeptidase
MGNRVLISTPAQLNPLADAAEVEVTGPDARRIALATGIGHHGETVSRRRGAGGEVEEIRFAGIRLLPEARIATELEARYGAQVPKEGSNIC